jgi:hypothetical protein
MAESKKELPNASAAGLDFTKVLEPLGLPGKAAVGTASYLLAPNASLISDMGKLGTAFDTLAKKIPLGIGKLYGLFEALTGGAGGAAKAMENAVTQFTKLNASLIRSRGIFNASSKENRVLINSIVDLQRANAEFGATTGEVQGLAISLSDALSVRLGDSFQQNFEQIAGTTTVLERLGVKTQDSVSAFADLNILFNSTPAQFNNFSRQIASFSDSTGQDFSKVFSDAQKSLDMFAEGLTSQETLAKFLRFQATSKQTGIEISALKGTLDKFDTIEGAQEAGGQLAAVFRQFGVDFNATEFAFMTQEEQQQALSDKLKEFMPRISGFGQRSRRLVLKQIQDAIGLTPAQLTRLSRGEDISVAGPPPAISEEQFRKAAERQLAADPQLKAKAAAETVLLSIAENVLKKAGKDLGGISDAATDFMAVFNKENIDRLERAMNILGSGETTFRKIKDLMNM